MKYVYLLLSFSFPLFSTAQIASDSLCIKNRVFKIVVIGSSTAAGTGPSVPDSAWVNRYRKALKAINPDNEVINLAQGGYSTFQLMPSDFSPPANRPVPDTLRNITRAIAHAPDAIVLNLPSNDTSTGVLPDKQLSNFETIWQTAQDANIPIWICTTQPKNYTSPTLLNYQMQVRDSILVRYGDYSIDFWNPFATPEGLIDSLYDSGDGTHMNDAAHRILAKKVLDKDLLSAVFSIPPNPDFALLNLKLENQLCGSEKEIVVIEFINLGHPSVLNEIVFQVNNAPPASRFPMQSLQSCVLDTMQIPISTETGGTYFLSADFGVNHVDDDSTNNSSNVTFHRFQQPSLYTNNQLSCLPTTFQIKTEIENAKHLNWYSDSLLQTSISNDLLWESPFLMESSTYYAQASRDTFNLQDSLSHITAINRDWNGMMLELVAKKKLEFKGLTFPINTLGEQNVIIYRKTGAIFGFENDSTAWNLTDIASVQVDVQRQIITLDLTPEVIAINDTLSLYILLENSAGQMSYAALGDTVSVSDTILQIQNGTGITHKFRERYYPRNFIGKIHYSFDAIRPNSCLSQVVPIDLEIVNLSIDLGVDSIILMTDNVVLEALSNFETYLWSNGDTTSTVLLSPIDWTANWQLLSLEVTDKNECSAIDSVWISTQISSTYKHISNSDIHIFPNPTSSALTISAPSFSTYSYSIFNKIGQHIFAKTNERENIIDVSGLHKGVYWIEIRNNSQTIRKSFLKI